MEKIPYKFVDGTTSVVEVADEFYKIFKNILDEENASNRIFKRKIVPLEKLTDVMVELVDQRKFFATEFTKALKDRLPKALDTLTASQKDLVNELFFNGKSQKEIAEMQGVKPIAIKYRLRRILKKLKNHLMQMEIEEVS